MEWSGWLRRGDRLPSTFYRLRFRKPFRIRPGSFGFVFDNTHHSGAPYAFPQREVHQQEHGQQAQR